MYLVLGQAADTAVVSNRSVCLLLHDFLCDDIVIDRMVMFSMGLLVLLSKRI
jgi:hypothetical protein